jgi:hypothetical protein
MGAQFNIQNLVSLWIALKLKCSVAVVRYLPLL